MANLKVAWREALMAASTVAKMASELGLRQDAETVLQWARWLASTQAVLRAWHWAVNLADELADKRVGQKADDSVALTAARMAMKWDTEQAVKKAAKKEYLMVGLWGASTVDDLVVRRDVPKVALTVAQLVAWMEFHLAWMMVDTMAGMKVARLVSPKV